MSDTPKMTDGRFLDAMRERFRREGWMDLEVRSNMACGEVSDNQDRRQCSGDIPFSVRRPVVLWFVRPRHRREEIQSFCAPCALAWWETPLVRAAKAIVAADEPIEDLIHDLEKVLREMGELP